MYLGYLLTADSLSSEEQAIFSYSTQNLENQLTASQVGNARFSVSTFAHPNLPQERRVLHHYSESEQCTLLVIGQVYYTYSGDQLRDAKGETLLQLYNQHGPDFFNHLSGEFVCLLIDEKRTRCFLASDHVATIPCYFVVGKTAVFFSSHAPTLSAFCKNDKIAKAFVEKQFHSYAPIYRTTPFASMHKVNPGSYVHFNQSKWITRPYWHPEKLNTLHTTFREAKANLKELLHSALEFRLDRAYTLGTHLSGGLDSSLLTDWCRELNRDQVPFMSFSWSPPVNAVPLRRANDERTLILSFASRRDIHVEFTDLRGEDYLAYLDDGAFPMDFPYEKHVQHKANQHGVNLLISAWGADEFAGVDNHAVRPYLFRHGKWLKFFKRNSSKGLKNQLIYLVNEGLFPRRRRPYTRWKTSQQLRKFLFASEELRMKDAGLYKSPKKMMLGILDYAHLADRCEYWYNSGQANGVQYSYPFIDKRVMEYCLQLPAEIFMEGNFEKPLIRALVSELVDGEALLSKQLPDPVLFERMGRIRKEVCPVLAGRLEDFVTLEEFGVFDLHAFRHWLSEANLKDESTCLEAEYILSYLTAANASIQCYCSNSKNKYE